MILIRKLSLIALIIAGLAACAPAPTAPNESALVDGAASSTSESWQTAPFRDVISGETFSFADFEGKTVFVHPMAVWCLNCRISQRSLRDFVMTEFSEDEVVFVSFTVEPQTPEADLLAYTQEQGFDWRFFVATPDMMRQLVDQFGFPISTPPVQPHFIIRADGTVTELLLGNPPPEQTVELIRQVIASQA
jgi:hypothetical protein